MVTVHREGPLFPPGTAAHLRLLEYRHPVVMAAFLPLARLASAAVFLVPEDMDHPSLSLPALHPGLDWVLGEVLLASEAPVKDRMPWVLDAAGSAQLEAAPNLL
jgi:hypothetical protein